MGKLVQLKDEEGEVFPNIFKTTPTSQKIEIGNVIIAYGQISHSFNNIGAIIKDIDISNLGLSAIYSTQLTHQISYVDNQYMKDSDVYLYSQSPTQIRVNIVNGYPAAINYYVNYLVIGKK